jgi:uncharacterized SAM-binding protein YcdF (DUF218 family)
VKLTRFIPRKARIVLLGMLVLLFGLALAAFLFPAQVLLMEGGPVQADAIVVLGGGMGERPSRAAELFKSGAAPEIIVSGAGDAEENRRLLESNGVPAASIELEPKSKSTKQNAQFSIPLLRRLGAKRVIIVTTWYHSRRALHAFQHYAPDMQFYSRPSYYGYPRAQWSHDGISGYIRAEYVKLAGYWVCYGVCPF